MGDKTITVYMTTVSGSSAIRKHQQTIVDTLSAKGVTFEEVDISAPGNEEKKDFMRQNAKSPSGKTPLPPQLFCGEKYLGDFDEFFNACEDNELDTFLGLATKTEVSEALVEVTGGKDD